MNDRLSVGLVGDCDYRILSVGADATRISRDVAEALGPSVLEHRANQKCRDAELDVFATLNHADERPGIEILQRTSACVV